MRAPDSVMFIAAASGALLAACRADAAPPVWAGYAANARHSAAAPAPTQAPAAIHWQTPVDKMPQYSDNELFIHYASPLITANGIILVPVKTGAAGGFAIQARNAAKGTLYYTQASDYVLPTNTQWVPSFPAALAGANTLYMAGAGGTVITRMPANTLHGTPGRRAFYGISIFDAHKAEMTANVVIDTPITADATGAIYFGFKVQGANAAGLSSGIARLSADGVGRWISAAAAAGDASITEAAMNCAPALSPDGSIVYIAVSNGSAGYLLGLDSATLAPKYKAALTDPASGKSAWITDLSSASPTIGPDGDVYYGVLENPFGSHNGRGWLLHFDAALATRKIPGSFGWDDTVSIVPAGSVGAYAGKSAYLVFAKYNNYIGTGTGDGMNRIAVLDPGATQPDAFTARRVAVMKEVITQLGPTPNPAAGGVYEWCINSAVVDAQGGAILAGSEDGHLYRWSLATNTLSAGLALNPAQAEAYTPTLAGPDGTIFAINKATLYAVGD